MKYLLTLFCTTLALGFTNPIVAEEFIYDSCEETEFYDYAEECEAYSYIPCYVVDCPPPACNPRCWNLFVTADYLYWQARSDELAYAFTETAIPGQLTADKFERVKPDFSSGVRLGLGTTLPYFDCWYFSAEWTYYESSSTDTARGATNIVPLWINPFANPLADTAEAKYKINLNIADLTLERAFCPTARLVMSPSIGVRGIWLDQDLDVNYIGGDLITPILAKNSIDLKGGGLRAGLSTKWNICSGISLIGWSNVNLLWSHIDITQRSLQVTGAVRDSISDSVCTVIPMFELFLGASWERKICATNVCARIGWEEQYLVNGIRLNQNTSGAATSDLIVHQLGGLALGGLTAGVSVGF